MLLEFFGMSLLPNAIDIGAGLLIYKSLRATAANVRGKFELASVGLVTGIRVVFHRKIDLPAQAQHSLCPPTCGLGKHRSRFE